MMCPYCLNSARLPVPPGIIPSDARYFDCPVCQENRVKNEFGETELSVEEPELEDLEELMEEDFNDLIEEDDEEYEEDID
jgi:hypothetical protein